jgi:hypothetical protein
MTRGQHARDTVAGGLEWLADHFRPDTDRSTDRDTDDRDRYPEDPSDSEQARGEGAGGVVVFSPDEVLLGARVVVTEAGMVAVFAVTGYPSEAYPGWLDPLLGYPGRLDVSVHITPVDPATAADRLRKQLARFESGRTHKAEHGQLPDPLVEAATEDAHELAARVARGEGRLFQVGLYLAVHGPDPETLAREVSAVRALAGSLLLAAQPASYRQWQGWTSCLPLGLNELNIGRTMDTDALAAAFPFTSPDLPAPDPVSTAAPDGVLYGLNLQSSGLVCWDRFTADNHNAVILGRSGAGKSYFAKLELLRLLYRGVTAFVLDPEDEYTRLTHAVGGTVIRLGAPGVTLNPLDLPLHVRPNGRRHAPADAVTRRGLFLHTFITVLLGAEPDPTGRAVLDEAITATYTRAGITQADPTTWTRPAPLLADLAAELTNHPDPAGAALAARLRPFTRGAFSGLFAAPTSTAAAGHLVSFSLREVPEELRPAATLLVLDHIWRDVSDPAHRRPRVVVVDEAWLFMQQPAAARWLHRMAKSARKHWAGLTFVSQDVADVLGTELGIAVITNSATQVLLRQAPQTIDEVVRVFDLSAGMRSFLLGAAVGQGLLCTGTWVAFHATASAVEDDLITTDPRYLAALAKAGDTATVELSDPYQDHDESGESGDPYADSNSDSDYRELEPRRSSDGDEDISSDLDQIGPDQDEQAAAPRRGGAPWASRDRW